MGKDIIFIVLLVTGSVFNEQCEKDINQDRPVVQIKYGTLEGTYLKAYNGRVYSSFGSIPYADPPVGEYRFEVARKLTAWGGRRDASELAPYCLQSYATPDQTPNPVQGQEDCLYINVFTPKLSFKEGSNDDNCDNCDTDGCPVIVYIHGGAYQELGSREYGGKYLMQSGKVILVTVNYRLGPLGFLSTEDEVLPGNIGLKDQVKALTFINKNIEAFGGNPKSITITGMSAGSSSVHFMYLSPLSRDLFQRGYGMSGSAFCPWPIQEAAKQKAQRLAAELGCPTDSSQELVNCLKTKDGSDIVSLVQKFQPYLKQPFTVFGPVVEVPNDNAFLTVSPYKLIKSGKFHDKPLILSLTGREGLYPAASFIANETLTAEVNNNWNEIAPFLLDYNYTVKPELHDEVSQKIRNFYYGSEEITVKNYDPIVVMVGDRHFNLDVSRAALLQASLSSSPIYMYQFFYRGADSLSVIFSHTQNNYGASHADDTAYGLSTVYINPEKTESDRAMVDRFVNMWTTYATTGIPSFGSDVKWKMISRQGHETGTINYLEIHSPNDFRQNKSNNFGNRDFWNTLPIYEPTSGRFGVSNN